MEDTKITFDFREPIMKSYAHLQVTLTPTDRQRGQISTNRPVTEIQWSAIKNVLHIGKPSDVVALTDETPPPVLAMIRRLCREHVSSDPETAHEVWRHIKHAIVHPEDVCIHCAAVASFDEPHEKNCPSRQVA